jgi:hypothetical protein
MLGLGVLFLSIYASGSSGTNGTAGVSVLFGSILGLSPEAARVAAIIGALVCIAMVAIARPLLFASIDEAVAEAAGVRVRALGVLFLGLVGVTAAETTQAIGALLLLGLLAAPAAAAVLFTKDAGCRPAALGRARGRRRVDRTRALVRDPGNAAELRHRRRRDARVRDRRGVSRSRRGPCRPPEARGSGDRNRPRRRLTRATRACGDPPAIDRFRGCWS